MISPFKSLMNGVIPTHSSLFGVEPVSQSESNAKRNRPHLAYWRWAEQSDVYFLPALTSKQHSKNETPYDFLDASRGLFHCPHASCRMRNSSSDRIISVRNHVLRHLNETVLRRKRKLMSMTSIKVPRIEPCGVPMFITCDDESTPSRAALKVCVRSRCYISRNWSRSSYLWYCNLGTPSFRESSRTVADSVRWPTHLTTTPGYEQMAFLDAVNNLLRPQER